MNPGGVLHAAGFGPLAVILVALVAVAGALLIHLAMRGRGRRSARGSLVPALVGIPDPQVLPARDPSLPDWPRADDPLLDEAALRQRMLEIAGIMGIPEQVLPQFAQPCAPEGEYVFLENGSYVYTAYERGGPMFEDRSLIADQILYFVFRDRCAMHAYLGTIGRNLGHEEQSRRAAQECYAMLDRYDPRWRKQLEHDREVSGATFGTRL